MNTDVNEGDLATLAGDSEAISSAVSSRGKVGDNSSAASTAMPGGTSGAALEAACTEIDNAVDALARALEKTADAATATQSDFNTVDNRRAGGFDHLGSVIGGHGYQGYGG